MKRIEDYLERGLTADEMAKEFSEFCSKMNDCSECKYYNTSCRYTFLLDEMPHDKTLCELFYEMFPNAPKDSTDTPRCCPSSLGWGHNCEESRSGFCAECWNRKCKDVIEGYEE